MPAHIRIQREDFEIADETAALARTGAGAIVTFTGHVRGDGGVTALEIEHYPGMTEREIGRMAAEAEGRWPLHGVTIIHRIGRLNQGEQIVLVAVAAAHREAAFQACEFLMDYLKTDAPFWKQEDRGGKLCWVEMKESDAAALRRWR